MSAQDPGSNDLPSLLELTIDSASDGLENGHFTSLDLVKAYLARIEEASEYKAVLQINPEALQEARDLDNERASRGRRSPLHGIPILVKDNIVTNGRMDVSAGSFALLGARPATESSLIAKLRAAGVLILGKTNLSEWANFRGLDIPQGWSPRGGQTLGTYYPNSTPESSSAGSAVATALGLSVAALGTETFGSIVDPAEINNVVGFKPSRGLIGTDGAIPISKRQDVIGCLTRTVKDAAHLLNHMAGRSELDDRTWSIPFNPLPDYVSFCNGTDLTGVRIGVPRNTWLSDAPGPIMKSFESALNTLRSAGATVVDHADFEAADEFKKLNQEVKGVVRSSEFKRDIAKYLETLETNPNNIHSAEDIIEFTKTHPHEDYPVRDIGKFLWTQAEGIDVNSEKYAEMVKQELYFGGEGGILGALEKYRVDVLLTPSSLGIANDLAAKMGFPVMAVPLGFWPEGTELKKGKGDLVTVASGMPYSLLLSTKAFSDASLIRVAYAFEQLTGVRKSGPKPFKVPRTELRDVQRHTGNI